MSNQSRRLRVGDVVRLKRPCLNNTAGSYGVVYEEYDIGDGPAVSIIFKNGWYDGFSPSDQDHFLSECVGRDSTVVGYQFDNVVRLSLDYQRGLFNNAFNWMSVEKS